MDRALSAKQEALVDALDSLVQASDAFACKPDDVRGLWRWSHGHVARVEHLCSLLLCPRGVWCSQHGTAASAAGSSDADALELEWLEPSTPIGPLDNAGDNDGAGANVIALK